MFALFSTHRALARFGIVIMRGHGIAADGTSMRVFKVMLGVFVTANSTLPAFVSMFARFMSSSANLADVIDIVFMSSMLVAANRTFPAIVNMLANFSTNSTNSGFGVVSMPRCIGISADFASMRTLVLMRRMFVAAYRANSVFIDMFGRFISNTADLTDMSGIVIVSGVYVAADSAGAAVVVMCTFLAAHGAFARCRVVIVNGHGITADSADV